MDIDDKFEEQFGLEPAYPAMIHAPDNPYESLLVALPEGQIFLELMNDHWAPGPDHWRSTDRLIDANGQVYSIKWGGYHEVFGGNYFITPLKEVVTADEVIQLLIEFHALVDRNPTRYINLISKLDEQDKIRESIAFLATLPRHPPLFYTKTLIGLAVFIAVLLLVFVLLKEYWS